MVGFSAKKFSLSLAVLSFIFLCLLSCCSCQTVGAEAVLILFITPAARLVHVVLYFSKQKKKGFCYKTQRLSLSTMGQLFLQLYFFFLQLYFTVAIDCSWNVTTVLNCMLWFWVAMKTLSQKWAQKLWRKSTWELLTREAEAEGIQIGKEDVKSPLFDLMYKKP